MFHSKYSSDNLIKGKQRVQKSMKGIIRNIEHVQKGESSTLQLVFFPAELDPHLYSNEQW